MDLGVRDKVALITGGSEGIGFGSALLLCQEGAKVAIAARRESVLAEAADRLRAAGGDVLALVADVSDPAQCELLIEQTVAHFGGLDILINNAGASAASAFDAVTDSTWGMDLDVKLLGAVRCSRAALPYLKRSSGAAILNVTAISGKAPGAGSLPTSVSRAAGLALTKAMSKDLGPHGIRVNAVCIGSVMSAQIERRLQQNPDLTLDQIQQQASKTIPLGRIGKTEEAANAMAFLVSPAAGYITGVALNIDGGLSPSL